MKNTNRLFFALLAAAALLFAAGCSSDGDDTITASDLAGTTWTYTFAPSMPSDTTYYTLSFSSDGTFAWVYVRAGDSNSDPNDFVSGAWSLSGSTLELAASKLGDYSVKDYLDEIVETAEDMTSDDDDDWDSQEKELYETLAEAAKKDTENPTFVYNGTCSSNAITITGLAINGVTIPYFLVPNGWSDSSITFSKQ